MSRSRISFVVAVMVTVGFAYVSGIWPFERDPYSIDRLVGVEGPGGEEPSHAAQPLPQATDGVRVLYDDSWYVAEGQWTIGDIDAMVESGESQASFKALLESDGPYGVRVTGPGFYGLYLTRVELHDAEPAVAAWCEDVAEASFRMTATGRFRMASFDTFSDSYALPTGWYRVRYCAEKQDVAATEEEFTDDEATTYTGRHLVQIWKAPRADDRVLVEGSAWARDFREDG